MLARLRECSRQVEAEATSSKGASSKYVCHEGGEGVQKSADFADKQSYRSADKGGGGPKIQKFLLTYLMEAPRCLELRREAP